ncbi:uncharacterized protein YALI1_C07152g [Yarrowia lipolytica]|uniref:Uncharacterized protein n=1 Tax=Yarrowia lipolytica TaxID=4952 RepID=A0A1D8N9R9_YARLL|nr:hypothetical protein YALI1_C07152g [Yarrowia lipolytica]
MELAYVDAMKQASNSSQRATPRIFWMDVSINRLNGSQERSQDLYPILQAFCGALAGQVIIGLSSNVFGKPLSVIISCIVGEAVFSRAEAGINESALSSRFPSTIGKSFPAPMEMVREKGSEESEGTSGEKFGKTRIESLDSDQTLLYLYSCPTCTLFCHFSSLLFPFCMFYHCSYNHVIN